MQKLFIFIMLFFSTGCYTYVPVTVRVIYAETGAPVKGVHVSAMYKYGIGQFHPDDYVHDTNSDGIVRIPIAISSSRKDLLPNYEGIFVRGGPLDGIDGKDIYRVDNPTNTLSFPTSRNIREFHANHVQEDHAADALQTTVRVIPLYLYRQKYRSAPNG